MGALHGSGCKWNFDFRWPIKRFMNTNGRPWSDSHHVRRYLLIQQVKFYAYILSVILLATYFLVEVEFVSLNELYR